MREALGIIINQRAQPRISSLTCPNDPKAHLNTIHRLHRFQICKLICEICGWFSKLVARDLLVQILAADSEYARALGLVAACCRQNLRNVSRFQLREALRLLLPLL